MLDLIDQVQNRGSLTVIIFSILLLFMSGIFFGITYFVMESVETGLQGVDCDIPNNVYVTNCQELFELSFYPVLALRELLVWISFFFMFAIVLGMLILGYRAGKSPVLLGILIVFVITFTYLSIELANVYRTMIESAVLRNMLTEFTVYNQIMLNFPWFIFIISLLSVLLSVVNYQRTKINSSREVLDY